MDWTPIRIPTDLFNEVQQLVKDKPEQGYTSIPEFVRDAVREKIAKVKLLEADP